MMRKITLLVLNIKFKRKSLSNVEKNSLTSYNEEDMKFGIYRKEMKHLKTQIQCKLEFAFLDR